MEKQRGFTIVELLIVIVVIAILAAISIISYNGIQQRARNTQMIAAAKGYQKAIMLYAADGNPYPSDLAIVPAYGACLGGDYPDERCWIGDNGNYKVEPTLDAALRKYMNSKPAIPTKSYKITAADDRMGIVYFPSRATKIPYIEYFLEGINQDCKLAGATGNNVGIGGTATSCRYTFAPQ